MTYINAYKSLINEEMPRMKHIAAATLIIFSACAGAASGIVFPNVSALLFTVAAVSLFSALLFMYRSPLIYSAPIISFVTSAIVSGSIPHALVSAVYAPAAIMLAVAFYQKSTKSRAITLSSITLAVTVLAVALVAFVIDRNVFPSIQSVREAIKNSLLSISINTRDGRAALFTEGAAAGLARYLTLSLPAIFIIIVNTVSYLSASLFALFVRIFYFADRIPGGKWIYMPELAPAVIFILSYTVSAVLVPFTAADVIGYAAENLLIALTPAMMIAGERVSFELSSKHDKKLLLVVLSIITLCFSPSLYLMIISFWGALFVIYKSFSPHLRKLFPKKDDDDDGM